MLTHTLLSNMLACRPKDRRALGTTVLSLPISTAERVLLVQWAFDENVARWTEGLEERFGSTQVDGERDGVDDEGGR